MELMLLSDWTCPWTWTQFTSGWLPALPSVKPFLPMIVWTGPVAGEEEQCGVAQCWEGLCMCLVRGPTPVRQSQGGGGLTLESESLLLWAWPSLCPAAHAPSPSLPFYSQRVSRRSTFLYFSQNSLEHLRKTFRFSTFIFVEHMNNN